MLKEQDPSCVEALRGTKITLPAVILYYSTLSGTNGQNLTPKRYDEHTRHFYRGVSPRVFYTKHRQTSHLANQTNTFNEFTPVLL